MARKKQEMPKLPDGTKILDGKYTIVESIKHSGMSNVYMAVNNFGISKCVKEVSTENWNKTTNVEIVSLRNEANILSQLNDPRIPRIDTMEDWNGNRYIIMDWINGDTLDKYIKNNNGRLNQKVAVPIMIELAEVMQYLHTRQTPVWYRDMKPSNVMIDPDGHVHLIDFGISVVVRHQGELIPNAYGTRGYCTKHSAYALPKYQTPIDLRDDIYSLGVTFYQMLTGLNPSPKQVNPNLTAYRELKDKNGNQILDAQGRVQYEFKPLSVVAPNTSQGLVNVVYKCLAINDDPDRGFKDCAELIDALEHYKTSDTLYKKKGMRKIKTVFSLMAIGAMLMIGSIIPKSLDANEQNDKYETAVQAAEQSGREEDYEKAISMNPLPLEPYYGYVNAIKQDGKFTKAEETKLLNYITPNIDEMKKEDGYAKLSFEIGKLYWYYYPEDSTDSREILSIKWFDDARSGSNKDQAECYYQLGVFKRDIASAMMESSDGGKYKEYWNNLMKIDKVNSGDVVTLQTKLAIANCISQYAYNLQKDGISEKDIKEQMDSITKFMNTYPIDQSTSESVKNYYTELQEVVPTLQAKVEAVYGRDE